MSIRPACRPARVVGAALHLFLLLGGLAGLLSGGCPAPSGTTGSDAGIDSGPARGEQSTSPPPPATPVGPVEVSIQDFAFQPRQVTVRVGQSVRWTNRDRVEHTVTSGNPFAAGSGQEFNSGLIAPGRAFTRTFDRPGTFEYFCIPHQFMSSMRGATVTVQP